MLRPAVFVGWIEGRVEGCLDRSGRCGTCLKFLQNSLSSSWKKERLGDDAPDIWVDGNDPCKADGVTYAGGDCRTDDSCFCVQG